MLLKFSYTGRFLLRIGVINLIFLWKGKLIFPNLSIPLLLISEQLDTVALNFYPFAHTLLLICFCIHGQFHIIVWINCAETFLALCFITELERNCIVGETFKCYFESCSKVLCSQITLYKVSLSSL